MGVIAANLAFEGHSLKDSEIECSPELMPYIEMVRKIACQIPLPKESGLQLGTANRFPVYSPAALGILTDARTFNLEILQLPVEQKT